LHQSSKGDEATGKPRRKAQFYLLDIIVVLGLIKVFFSAVARTLVGVGLCAAAAGLGIVEERETQSSAERTSQPTPVLLGPRADLRSPDATDWRPDRGTQIILLWTKAHEASASSPRETRPSVIRSAAYLRRVRQ
jgi:hypothetical protein